MEERNKLFAKISGICEQLEKQSDIIPEERKEKLILLRKYVGEKIQENKTSKLVVICTHNSRRSHIGQIWLAVVADYLQLPKIQTFSGGTEATAFNIRAVEAFKRIGFEISPKDKKSDNPVYEVKWKDEMQPYKAFSKKYTETPNPIEKYGAIMVCSEADAGCPIVTGCDFRLSLPYDDPKDFDETSLEEEKYDERVKQIGREIIFSFKSLNKG